MNKKIAKIALIHYSYPPVAGGVEFVIRSHAKLFAKDRHQVRIITGEGEESNPNIEVKIIPEIRSLSHSYPNIDEELKQGIVSKKFHQLKEVISRRIKETLKDIDVCIIHNVMTMHFNLALTSALNEIINDSSSKIKFYIWCHDIALTNSSYPQLIRNISNYPWNLLGRFNKKAEYITISQLRKRQLSHLFKVKEDYIKVVPNGIDIKSFLNLSNPIWKLAQDKKLFDADLVMFFPSRILKRKNYELGIKIVKEFKKMGKNCKFLTTALPDPHNPEASRYSNYLHQLSRKLKVEEDIIFIQDLKEEYALKIDHQEIKNLYSICDLLLLTSSQEGFGIPLLEAGAMKLPIVCSNIEPLSEIVDDFALKFDLKDSPSLIAERILEYITHQPTFLMFKKIVRNYSWDAIYRDYLKEIIIQPQMNTDYR